MGKYSAHLVGESFYQSAIATIKPGTPVKLVPEPDNPHDPRAIKAVTRDGQVIGYLERDGWLTRVMLDDGTPVASRISEIIGGEVGKPTRGVVLEVLTGVEATAALARSQQSSQPKGVQPPADIKIPTWAYVVGAICILAIMIISTAQTSEKRAPSKSVEPIARTASAGGDLPAVAAWYRTLLSTGSSCDDAQQELVRKMKSVSGTTAQLKAFEAARQTERA